MKHGSLALVAAILAAIVTGCAPDGRPTDEEAAADDGGRLTAEDARGGPPEETADEPAAKLPDGFGADWTPDGPTKAYTEDNLFELINGEAELYWPYDFQRCWARDYVKEDGRVMAHVFLMGSHLDAFGIYSTYRQEPDEEAIGAGSSGDGLQLVAYKGPYFVRIQGAGEFGGDPQPTLRACGGAIAALLDGAESPPEELERILVEGVDAGSVQYIADSLLGYEFFKEGLMARTDGETAAGRPFVVLTHTPEFTAETLQAYSDYLVKYDQQLVETRFGFTAEDPLHRTVVLRDAGDALVGVAKLSEPTEGADLLERLAASNE
jgi:hypothetical protein